MISIVDYGIGNLRSVEKALQFVGLQSQITFDESKLLDSNAIILPGVGAFPDAMDNLKKRGLDMIIKKVATQNKPILGICLGMQLLFDESDEIRLTAGLGLIPGRIEKFNEKQVKIPHMGWNSLKVVQENSILKGINQEDYVYFVHSYYAVLKNRKNLIAETDYDVRAAAVVAEGNIYGMQFHPEKSGEIGIKMLRNFGEMIK
jgi:glutamine amidotransferase